jgi:hypothetical protein
MDNNFDFDITNYNFNDLINLFNVSSNLNDEDFIKCKNYISQLKNNNLNEEIINFFSNSYFILLCIKKYRDFLILNDKNYLLQSSDDDFLLNEILLLPNFKNYNDSLLVVNKILEKKNLTQKSINNDNNLLSELINEIKSSKVFNVYNNDIGKGNINPVKRITHLTNFHFNSCFRENYYNSNPTNFKYKIPTGGVKNVVSLKLSSIEIPNSWFLFSSIIKNNQFIVEITYCNKCSVHNIVIPDGNYDRDNLITFLNDKYFVNSNNELLKNIEISIDTYTNRTYFKLANCAPDNFVFSLHFVEKEQTNILETFGWIMGFRLAKYLKINDVIQSEGLFDGGGDRYIFMCLNDYQYNYNENNVACFDNMSINENILAKIPLLNGKFSLTMNENNYNPLVKIKRYNAPVNINKIEVKLLDKFGNIINLNNMDWSFSIEFEVLYENILLNNINNKNS